MKPLIRHLAHAAAVASVILACSARAAEDKGDNLTQPSRGGVFAGDQQPVEQIIVTPEETDEILANPGMGWETFHRTSKQDQSLPSWIPSTVHYARWGWGELEPQPSQLNTEFLDTVLKETRDAGQKLAFRVMTCSTSINHPYHPKWITEVGGKELLADYDGHGPFPIPDMDDPVVLQRHLDFIKRLGERYDGQADIDHLDLGSIGWWGEWHLSGSKHKVPTLENRMKVVDAYLAAFKKTSLVMLIGGGDCLKYACDHGAGWRADCLGDMGGFSKNWCTPRSSTTSLLPCRTPKTCGPNWNDFSAGSATVLSSRN